jgi:hypothetical protein
VPVILPIGSILSNSTSCCDRLSSEAVVRREQMMGMSA